ncbi:MAG: DUF302 domain-containing protein [Bryobacteraceae bacterium]
MTGDQQPTTLLVRQPFTDTIKVIRRALMAAGLEIPADLDLAGRVKQALRFDFPPCRVLCVDCPIALLEALALDRSAAVLLPLHLVVEGRDGFTLVHLLNPAAALHGGLPVTARAAVSKLQGRVRDAIKTVSARQFPAEIGT